MARTFKSIFLTFAIITVVINFITYFCSIGENASDFGIYLTSYEKNNPSVLFFNFLPYSSLFSLIITFIFFFRYNDIENLQKINKKSNTISKLKNKLESIELQIQSCKKIEETGKMSKEEKNEWLNLAKEHKQITDKIRGLMIKDDSIEEDSQNIIKDNKSSEEVWLCTCCKEENPLTFDFCSKCSTQKNNTL